MKIPKSLFVLPVVFIICLVTAGCGVKDFKPSKIFSLDNTWPFDDNDDEPEEGVPVRLVGAWTDTVHTKPGQKAQRGFGGRLMFYGPKDEKPILVDGQLVVYAFDEAGRQPTDTKPTRRYVFPPDQIAMHMSKSDIGASYSFWLPWDEVGGPKAEVSLICRFEPKGGPVITGEQTRHMLPGPVGTETTANAGTGPKLPEGEPYRPAQQTLEGLQSQNNAQHIARLTAQQTNYLAPANSQAMVTTAAAANVPNVAANMPGRQMSVTSIALPNNFQMPDASAFAQPAPQTPTGAAPAQTMVPIQQQPQMMPPAQFQQPVTGVQPIYQAAQPPVTSGAALRQQVPGAQFQPGVMPATPRLSTPGVAGPVMYSPQHQGFGMPQVGSQYVNQQAAIPPAGQSMVMQASATMPGAMPMNAMPQQQAAQPMLLSPQQQVAMPVQQAIPLQNLQQLAPANALRSSTVSSPTTATIPWR
jgi:hypothetical protein